MKQTVDNAFRQVKRYIKNYYSRDIVNLIYENVKNNTHVFNEEQKKKVMQVQIELLDEAEKYARDNPCVSLAFISYTNKNFDLPATYFYKRSMLIDYCLAQIDFETARHFPHWMLCRWKYLNAKESETFYIRLDKRTKLILTRKTKTVKWDFIYVVDGKEVCRKNVALFTLSKWNISYDFYFDPFFDGYIVTVKTPKVVYTVKCNENLRKMEVTRC